MKTVEDFKAYVNEVEAKSGYQKPVAFGLGVRKTKNDKTLEVNFPHINFETAFGTAALLLDVSNYADTRNGFISISKAQLQEAFDKFSAFHHEIEKHPNIVIIKTLLDAISDVQGYATVSYTHLTLPTTPYV